MQLLPTCRAATAALALLASAAAGAQPWPQRPIQIIVGFSPGGAADVLARALADSMAKTLGQPVLVVNRDGASGTIATAAVAKAEPDGHTLGFGPAGPLVLQPHLKAMAYKLSDLGGVCQTFVNNYALATSPTGRFKTLKEAMDAAQKKPNAVTYGTGGIGSFPHMAAIQLGQKAGVELRAVPYRGDPPVILALKSGEVDMGTISVGLAQTQGMRILGVFSPARLPEAQDAPTMVEQGYPVLAQLFGGLYAPKGLPPAVRQSLGAACEQAVNSDKYQSASRSSQQDVVFRGADDFTKALERESQAQERAVRSANLKLD